MTRTRAVVCWIAWKAGDWLDTRGMHRLALLIDWIVYGR